VINSTGRKRKSGAGTNGWWARIHQNAVIAATFLAGNMTLQQERPDGSKQSVVLGPGEYAINELGTWHTADFIGEATVLFITAGVGTQHRPR
jgi:hypothetical protein